MRSFFTRLLWAFCTHSVAFAFGVLVLAVPAAITSGDDSCIRNFALINPRLRCEEGLQQGEWDYEFLRDTLLLKKNDYKANGDVSHLSVYFRDLDYGPRFGIGEYDKFQPASLRKVPVLITYLHLADLDPAILEKTLSFSGALRINQNMPASEYTIQPDTPYTVRELLTKMIVHSDNYSYLLLTEEMNAITPIIPYYTFRDLDVLRMMMDAKGEYISIQSYGNLFAVLYNTGYLSKGMSQYALELLSQATFAEGLVADLPQGVRVAHKFGERFEPDGENQLHDCGIVYHPVTNYTLCVMTTGTDFEKQKAAIAEISRMVYDGVSSLPLSREAGESRSSP